MAKIYLDMIVFDHIIKNEELERKIDKLVNKHRFYYSGAHAEEILKMYKKTDESSIEKIQRRIKFIDFLTGGKKLHMTLKSGVDCSNETFAKCYGRVLADDTTDIVNKKAINHFSEVRENLVEERELCKELINISNLDEVSIWENEIVKRKLEEMNRDIGKKINEYNNSLENQVVYMKYGFRAKLPQNFIFEKGMYNKIQNNFHTLEYTIESLHNLFSEIGYNGERKVGKFQSSIHDVSHTIYASYCQQFVTEDNKLIARTKAIYNYLGIETQVMKIDELLK